MGQIIMPGGSGGIMSDDLTALADNVLEGKTAVTFDSDDEIVEGTLAKSKVLVEAGGTLSNYDMSYEFF